MVKRDFVLTGIISLVLLFPIYAVEFSVESKGNSYDFDIGGYGGFTGGQIIRGLGVRGDFDHKWIENVFLGILFDATINNRVRVTLNGEFNELFSYDVPETELGKENKLDMFWVGYYFYLREARGILTLGDPEQFSFQIHGGKWQYKYNPEVRNLGEYLFRGNAYPTYYVSKFDDPTAPLMGLMLSTMLNKTLIKPKLDLMLTSETAKYPLQDWSLSGVASLKFGDFWDHGDILGFSAGICFDRLIPRDDYYTTPKEGVFKDKWYDADIELDTMKDSLGNVIWDISDPSNIHPEWDTVTTNRKYYTFKSKKAAFRITLDPKAIFPWENIFGEEDCKLYGEIAFLGFENYGDYYDVLHERMPYMLGFNFPTFKILDVLAVEFEWFKNPYIPGYDYAFRHGWPEPVHDRDVNRTKFYWSVYGRKTFGAIKIVTQFSRDHMRPHVNNFNYTEWNDVLVEAKDWYWIAKIEFGI